MEYLYIGIYVNTHGVKGEIRIISDITYKDKIFVIGKNLYLGDEKKVFTIRSYRKHKNYDMITFNDIDNINEIEMYKGSDVYVKRSDIAEFIIDDIIGYKFYEEDRYIGLVTDVIQNKNSIIEINDNILVPNQKELIIKIDNDKKEIYYKKIVGLIP